MELSFSPFDHRRDLAEQRALFRDAFPEALGTAAETDAHYLWKFQGGLPSHEYIARLPDGSMAGYYAAIEYPYRGQGTGWNVAMVCDVMTSTRSRGKGVFANLGAYAVGEMARIGLPFCVGYPIRPEVIPGHLKVGWGIRHVLPLYVKPVRVSEMLASKGLSWAAPLGNAVLRLWGGAVRLLGRRGSGIEVTEVSLEAALASTWLDPFISAWLASVPFGLEKRARFLRWRLGAPGASYRLFTARVGDGRTIGLCITREARLKGIHSLALLDVMLLERHADVFAAFDRVLSETASERGVSVIAGMFNPVWAKRMEIGRRGFFSTSNRFKLITRHLSGSQADLAPQHWPLMWIDTDDL